jgi:hypothetical protein
LAEARNKRTPPPATLDGFQWDAQTEARLNQLAHRIFTTGDGHEFLNYLANITLNRPFGPGVAPDTLMHLEGQRYIVGIVKARIQQAEKADAPSYPKPDLDGPSDAGS